MKLQRMRWHSHALKTTLRNVDVLYALLTVLTTKVHKMLGQWISQEACRQINSSLFTVHCLNVHTCTG